MAHIIINTQYVDGDGKPLYKLGAAIGEDNAVHFESTKPKLQEAAIDIAQQMANHLEVFRDSISLPELDVYSTFR